MNENVNKSILVKQLKFKKKVAGVNAISSKQSQKESKMAVADVMEIGGTHTKYLLGRCRSTN